MLAKPAWHKAEGETDEIAEAPVQPFVAARPAIAHQLAYRRIVETDSQPHEERGQQFALSGPKPIRNPSDEGRFGQFGQIEHGTRREVVL